MKRVSAKSKKQNLKAGSKDKPVCGTLSYLAECRGLAQKSGTARKPELSAGMKKNVRKNPVD